MSVMTVPPSSFALTPIVPTEPIYRLSVDQYHALIELGNLTEDNPIELLEGWLVPKMPKKPPHSIATPSVVDAVSPLLPLQWHLRVQEPITTPESEPEPDIAVVQGARRRYLERHPGPEEIGMVIEVADSSLQRDRATKKRIYARANIPIYWIVNLIERQVEVYTNPTGPAENPDYQQRQDYAADQEMPFILEGKALGLIKVVEILP